jgi:dTDP-glucose 4,6-dehydratase
MDSQIGQRKVKNILVTGGAGFIGSAFVRYLLSESVNFQGTCLNVDILTYAGNLDNLQEVSSDSRYTFIKADICHQNVIEHLCQKYAIDTIIHFAAESHVDRSISGPKAFIEANVIGTFHLLEIVRKYPSIHFHHVSTDEVYGSLGATDYFTENSAYHPNSPYSASKAASDHFVRAYGHTYQLSTCISNCSNNYGPYQFPEKLIPLLILNCMKKEPLPIYGEGIHVRDWLHVDDHAKALYILLQKGKKGETYAIGGESEWRNIDLVHELIRLYAALKNENPQELLDLITFVKDRPGHDMRYAIDCSKIKGQIGWKPVHSFSEGLRQTIKWYINHQEWVKRVQTGAYQEWLQAQYV